jgi:imidazolonepropionase-like amidohydrolase
MATINGSIALGINKHAGSLEPGKTASFLYLAIDALDQNTLLERLIHEACNEKVQLINHDRK